MKKAVLIGHNFVSLLGIARALGKNGYEIAVIRAGSASASRRSIKNLGNRIEAKSKYVTAYAAENVHSPEKILQTLRRFSVPQEKSLLIPVDDVCAQLIDENYDQLQSMYLMPNIGHRQGEILRHMDKYLQKQLAAQAGLPVLRGWSVSIRQGAYTLPEDIAYPCFAKAQLPLPERKSLMGKCENRQELVRLLDKAAAFQDCLMLVEEYAPIEREYCIIGLCDQSRVCIPEIIDETIMGHGAHAGVTCYGKVLLPDFFGEHLEQFKTFLSRLDFQGMFTIDVIISQGRMYFCELNLRMGGSGIAVIEAGVNLPLMLAQVLEGDHTQSFACTCRQITFASERPLLNDYTTGYMTWKQYRQYLRQADCRFIRSADDPGPSRSYALYVLRSMLKKCLRKRK